MADGMKKQLQRAIDHSIVGMRLVPRQGAPDWQLQLLLVPTTALLLAGEGSNSHADLPVAAAAAAARASVALPPAAAPAAAAAAAPALGPAAPHAATAAGAPAVAGAQQLPPLRETRDLVEAFDGLVALAHAVKVGEGGGRAGGHVCAAGSQQDWGAGWRGR
jgi:hypothetical protein